MALLTPLTIKSTRSMLAMQALQPEMQKLRAKYKGPENREQLNQELMRLYRENNVSPTGGCLPMLLQTPFLIVLYDVIKGLTNTVKRGSALATGKKCAHLVCATPRYIPHTSAMYRHLIANPGVMKSMGLNLATKPLSHHSHWFEYIPYIAFVVVAVGLQYFQMQQVTKRARRNPSQAQMPQQMQNIQKIMPLFFAYIYFLVPAGVVIYMIVSSAIRVATQDVIFRFGIVQVPGMERQERQIGATGGAGEGGLRALLRRASPAPAAVPAASQAPAGGSGGARANGHKPAPPAQAGPASKAHPRSKSKRTRKAR
jgi:YidC/Oxa1 family membrane protein insertase